MNYKSFIAASLMTGGLFLWIILAMKVCDVPSSVLRWLKDSESALALVGRWLRNPRNTAKTIRWAVRVVAFGAFVYALGFMESQADFRGEIAGTAFTIFVIEEIAQWRSWLEHKESIIKQMASRSNDFAVEAARLARIEGWLKDGSLQGSDFANANLTDVDLSNADLKSANFYKANLQDADLRCADLSDTELTDANLGGAKLMDANLQNAQMQRAKFKGATIFYANLNGTNLIEAELNGAFLTDAKNLLNAQFVDTHYDNSTKWPKPFEETVKRLTRDGLLINDDETSSER